MAFTDDFLLMIIYTMNSVREPVKDLNVQK